MATGGIKDRAVGLLPILLEFVMLLLRVAYECARATIKFFVPLQYKAKRMQGEIVLITGSAAGLGDLLAVRFARLGNTVVLWDVDASGNDAIAALARKEGAKAYAYTVDMANRDAIYAAAAEVRRDVGDVTVLVNNAGVVTGKKLLEADDNLVEKMFAVNTIAHFWTAKAFLPSMLEHNHGHVVTIASSAGLVGVNGLVDYCASKFGAVGFDQALRFELDATGKDGIHSTCICPYFINTGMFDGVNAKFPALCPILEAEYASDKIMEAILTNQKMLLMPRALYWVCTLLLLLPVEAQFYVADFIGISHSMSTFKGHGTK
ncbi:PREDICTED: epidermal retinol dehydrogenase 2-like [Priapulus caudatus]|uniref:Epidermal retinol dehydrogenase 2-like n=1 Tax=Priapulus caudatus TaxID=37621 RepID=A0ABM1EYI9_PRICU|nr:PREDICTED: epidermal retinol dehydrogenase 2-like [Priapulus caudatus]